MSTTEHFTPQPAAGAPHYTSIFADGAHGASFARSYLSELKKLKLRSMLITAALAIIMYNLVIWFVFDPEWATPGNSQAIVGGWTFQAIFMVVIGALTVTSEYSSNTMRTTSLSDPNRLRAFFAKILAVFTFSWVTMAISTAVSCAIMVIRLGGLSMDGEDARVLAFYTLILALFAVFTTGLGYLVRSTAGTIVLSFGVLYMLDIFSLIPMDFFSKVFPQLTPGSVANKAILGPEEDMTVFSGGDPIVTSYWLAWAIFLGYVVVAVAVGAIRYKKSDI